MPRTIIREGVSREISWWEQYVGSLRGEYGIDSNFSAEAINEIDRSTNEIFNEENIPMFDSEVWNEDNGLRIGAVVGSIQSGKTANMIGLAAKGLDRGFRIVIVLGGLKNDLRSQTASRFCRDLLCKGEAIIEDNVVLGYNHPLGQGIHGPRNDCWTPKSSGDINHQVNFVRRKLRTVLRRGNTVLLIAKKNVQTLASLTDALEGLCSQIPASDIPLLIIDDEFDEASVQRNPEAPTPDSIAQIWGNRGHKVAYVGYTATIQANILQDTAERLWPKNFIELIRYPAARESPLTFFEPNPNARYTGPEVFFTYLDNHNERNFLVDHQMSDDEFRGLTTDDPKLEQALISYFISGCLRLLISEKSLDDTENLAPPHTMLIHTQLEIEEHWEMVQKVMRLMREKGGDSTPIPRNYRRIPPQDRISLQHLETWLENEVDEWKNVYNDFRESSEIIIRVQPDRVRYSYPSWDEVKETLPNVFYNTKLRVINSDDLTKDLNFSSRINEDGIKDLPLDLYSIIVGGNKLSRGLTLEGLCISYFCRSSEIIAEDTTVQRERWFGFRGQHLEFCRLFSNIRMTDTLTRFVYHEIDLKEQFVESKRRGVRHWDSRAFRFLTTSHSTPSHATGRGRLTNIQFSGTKPFIQNIQMGESDIELNFAAANVNRFAELCDKIIDQGLTIESSDGREIGYCLYDQSVDELIELLEDLSFTFHNPSQDSQRFINLENLIKQPNPELNQNIGFKPSQDPYLIAAYLKHWKIGFETRAGNLQNNDGMRWNPIQPPNFNFAIRFGSLDNEEPFDFPMMNREISEEGVMTSTWGSRGYGTDHVDEWFDEPRPHDGLPPFRHHGHNGLVLIHVVSKHSTGRNGNGVAYVYPRPTIGMNIPLGGPAISATDTGD